MTKVIGINIDETSYQIATNSIITWAQQKKCRIVCAANVHMLMEAHDSAVYRKILNSADLVTPDGMPLVWIMRFKANREQERVYGPTLMLFILNAAAKSKIKVGFYGARAEVIDLLALRMKERFLDLDITYSHSPLFRELSPEEDATIVNDINLSGARILFVGLGCPKQEIWMSNHRGKINAVMLGVGAAFDFHAGVKPQAPAWMQRLGLEWLYRLYIEPRRLWKRYLYHNPRFVLLAILDLLGVSFSDHA